MTIAIPALALLLVLVAVAGALAAHGVSRWQLHSETEARAALEQEKSALAREKSTLEQEKSTLEQEKSALVEDLSKQQKESAGLQAALSQAESLAQELLAAPPPPSRSELLTSAPPRVSGIQEIGRLPPVPFPTGRELSSLAEELWVAAGRPTAKDREFWFQAEAQILRERIQAAERRLSEPPPKRESDHTDLSAAAG